MKTIFIILFSLASSLSFAVPTKDCPENLNLRSDLFDAVEEIPFSEENPRLPYAYKFLTEAGYVKGELRLQTKSNGKCYYKGDSGYSKFYSATIEGSLKENAKNKATLVLYWNETETRVDWQYRFIAYTSIKDLKNGFLKLDDTTSVYYAGTQGGGEVPKYFKVADTKLHFLDAPACISFKEAKEVLVNHLAASTSHPRKKTTVESLVRAEDFRSIEFLDGYDGYYTDYVQRWECAPSADCWWGYYVDCEGNIDRWWLGDE